MSNRNWEYDNTSVSGTVERVWEDGFSLNTGDRIFQVDTWDLYRDSTPIYISVGERLTVSGELDDGEFDAVSITVESYGNDGAENDSDGKNLPIDDDPDSVDGNTSISGIVERVWEDGFSLNTGDRIIEVDTWDLYRDSTPSFVSVSTEVTVSGEFDDGEFDADSITLESSIEIPSENSSGVSDDNGSGSNNSSGSGVPNSNRRQVIRGTERSDDLVGGRGRDRLFGRGGDDDLLGRAGNDLLVGGGGDDDLFGGNGKDKLRGGRGEDDLLGGAGRDILIGNAGEDTFILQPNGNDIIRDFQDGVDELGLADGLRFNNLLVQQQGNNTVISSDGDRVALLRGVDANSITQADLD